MHKITIDDKEYFIDKSSNLNLLIALQNQKAPVKYGCLIGVCGVCAFKVNNEKNVEYLPNYDPLFPIDGDIIYPCCCKATGDLQLNKIK